MQPETPEAPINMMSAAYGAGCKAGLAEDYMAEQNPHTPGSTEYKEWQAGWHWGVRNWDGNMNDGG
jgi:hypothetical protein